MSSSSDYLRLVPGDRNSAVTLPTKQPMTISSTCYVSSVRTTLCDIMCTVNASIPLHLVPPADKLKPLTAKFPYGKSPQQTLKKKMKHTTLYQDMMMTENQHRVEKELRKDRESFFAQLRQEKMEVDARRNAAAVKIQALFRGFRKRRRPVEYIRRRKKRRVHSQNDMQDELCTLAAKLGLKPIDGLSLETRSKTSRRKERIMNAAAFILHRFFAMILQRGRARRRVEERREEIINFCARIITRAVRYVKVKKFVKKCENIKHEQMALKIQCRTRIFHAREKVRVAAKKRHQRAKQEEAAIIIQRNLAPKNRAYNLARLTMVTMRTYQRIADDVVNFITDFLLEGGIRSVADIFATQISDKYELVFPEVESRIEENLINEAVVIEMHIWLEEQMLALLAENQRISELAEERRRLEAELGLTGEGTDGISWDAVPDDYFETSQPGTEESAAHTPVRVPSPDHLLEHVQGLLNGEKTGSGSATNSRNASRRDLFEGSRSRQHSMRDALVAPSVVHRSRFLTHRGSLSGMATGSFSLHGPAGPPGSSFSVSTHQYSRAMNRLSSVDMTPNGKFQAALLAANLAAGSGSFDFSPNAHMSNQNSVRDMNGSGDLDEAATGRFSRVPSVRFADSDSPDASPARPITPGDARFGSVLVLGQLGIAEGDEEDEGEDTPHSPTRTSASNHESFVLPEAHQLPELVEGDNESVGTADDQSLVNTADDTSLAGDDQSQVAEDENETDTNAAVAEPTLPAPELVPSAASVDTADSQTNGETNDEDFDEDLFRRSVTSDFAEAFASMSITSVLNAFGDSLVLGGAADEDEEESHTILQPNFSEGIGMQGSLEEDFTMDNSVANSVENTADYTAENTADNNSQDNTAEGSAENTADNTADQTLDQTADQTVEPSQDTDEPQQDSYPEPEPEEELSFASEIEENYYDRSLAGSIDSVDAARHVEEWEVCRDFTTLSITEPEKREIDQLFKDALYAFHKAKYQRASDVLESFLPILHKFPSSDPFHPDVARVQTTIKTIKARILFETAQYADAKEVFDDALQHRIEVFGKAHYLCVELYYFIGEWHRSQAEYDIAEKYLHQASQNVAGLIKMQQDANSGAKFDIKLWNAKNRVLVAQAELCKQCGQYYKANLTIMQVQESLRMFECSDAESVRIQESFVCCWVSALTINGKYTQSVALHQELLDKRRMRLGGSHPKVATSLCALGTLKLLRSEHSQAMDMLDESLTIRRQIYPADHPAIAASLFAKGMAYSRMGMFPEAAADMTHSLEMRRMKLGSTHPSFAQSASALAVIQTQMGDPLRAWKNHNTALEIFRSRYGVDKHRDIAQGLFNMACNAESRGSYLEAVAYHEQALQLKEEVMQLLRSETMGAADLHLGVELSRVHVARCYALVSRLDEAKSMLKNAVKNITRILGNRSDHVAHSLCSLGELCKIRGNYADAKQLYALAFNITQELFGDDHPLIATTMLLSSENLRVPGLYQEAIELERSAYDVRSYLFGTENVYTAMAVYQRAQLLRDCGKLSKAEKYYLRAMHILITKLGDTSGLYGVLLGDFAECCRLQGKLSLAEKHFRHAIDLQKGSHGELSLQMNETICNFTLLLMDLHHPGDAAQILQENVVPTFDRLLGKEHPTSMYARANLALSSQFVRFFMSQGTAEGSTILESVLGHPDIITFLEACRASSFAPDHPWLLRFSEGSTTVASVLSGTPPRTPIGGSDAGDNNSVQSSVTGFQTMGSGPQLSGRPLSSAGQSLEQQSLQRSLQEAQSLSQRQSGSQLQGQSADFIPSQSYEASQSLDGPPSYESNTNTYTAPSTFNTTTDRTNSFTNDTNTYTPRGASLEGSQETSGAPRSMFSPSESDANSVHSYADSQSQYTHSEATNSLAGSMSYSGATSVTQSQSRSVYPPHTQRTDYSSRPGNSISEYSHEDSLSQGQSQSRSQTGTYQTGSQSGYYSAPYRSDSYLSQQQSALIEYSDDYSVHSGSVSMASSVSPRPSRARRDFSVTPSSSVVSRQLRNYEESSLGSWDQRDEQVSLDEYFSRSQTLGDDESVGTMESLYHD